MINHVLFHSIRPELGQPLPISSTVQFCYNCSIFFSSAFRKMLGYALKPYQPLPDISIMQFNFIFAIAVLMVASALIIAYGILKVSGFA